MQLNKGRHDRLTQFEEESGSVPRRQSVMPTSLHTDSIDYSNEDGKGLGLQQVQEEVNEHEILETQQKLMAKKATIDEEDEQQKKYLQDLQIID